MQNRYLFRGKRLDNGEWIIGYLWVNRTATRETYHITDDYGEMQSVDPATIGQCTGLKDKNSKLVFEGDIIKHEKIDPLEMLDIRIKGEREQIIEKQYINSVILFNAEMAHFQMDTKEIYNEIFSISAYKDIEIVGNIHDNPELLNREESK